MDTKKYRMDLLGTNVLLYKLVYYNNVKLLQLIPNREKQKKILVMMRDGKKGKKIATT